MNNRFPGMRLIVAALALAALAGPIQADVATDVSQQLEPAQISLGETAQLTASATGDQQLPSIPPAVPGLEFTNTAQSTQIQTVNGQTTATSSVTWQVTPLQAGVFTIPALLPGAQPAVLRVSATAGSTNSVSTQTSGTSNTAPDGSAFVRLQVPKDSLYVGESIPVEIQVGMREGLVASLNGLPTLNGDAFTLNRLSDKPAQTTEIIGGKPYTVLSWRSALAAIKPGSLTLTFETPVTVRMRTARAPSTDLLQSLSLDNIFNDPFFQNFFGGTTERDITIASIPTSFNVLALPAAGKPAGFSGAVGNFTISSDLSSTTATAGDPVTLHLRITGAGNFDRVSSTMLASTAPWKAYTAAGKFTSSDAAGDRGEKDFEQALITSQSGQLTVPPLTFSFFNPSTAQYETERTLPLEISVAPALAGNAAQSAGTSTALSAAPAEPASTRGARLELRHDHLDAGTAVRSLRPLYFRPGFAAVPSALSLALIGAAIWLRRRERPGDASTGAPDALQTLVKQMDAAAEVDDAVGFFAAARALLQQRLGSQWNVPPANIDLAQIDARLGGKSGPVHRVFELADEATYAGPGLQTIDFERWKQIVSGELARGSIA